MRKQIRIGLLAGTAGLLAVGGTTAACTAQGNGQQTKAPASTSTTAPAKVSADRARQIAQQLVPGGAVTETDLDHEHGRAVWEVDLTKNNRDYDVHIDAATGKIIGVSASPTASRHASPTASAKVSAERARQIAQHRVPGATVTKTELDHEHGRAVWEIDLTKQHREYDVHIDAATGKLISVHHDTGTGGHD
jgi:uncharacterized membrane protein YkoI